MKRALLFLLFPFSALADQTRVFISSAQDGIYETLLDEQTGELTNTRKLVDLKGSSFFALNETAKVLYSTARVEDNQGGVASFKIKERSLEPLNEQSYPGKGLCHLSVDFDAKVLFGADYGGGSVVSFPLAEGGAIGDHASYIIHSGSSVHPRQKKPHAHSFYPTPDNTHAYAADLGTDKVEIYSFDTQSAQISSFGSVQVPPGSGPRHLKFNHDGTAMYVLNELTLTITVFKRNPKNEDSETIETVSVMPSGFKSEKMTCSEILISTDGKYVYTANRDLTEQGRDSVSMLSVKENGSLEWKQTTPAGAWIPRNINLTPSGKYLLVAGQKSNKISVLAIDPKNGEMALTSHETDVPKPMCIVFP